MSVEFSHQFSRVNNDPGDKKALIKQLKKSFDKKDLAWLKDDHIQVERTKVPLHDIDDRDRRTWAATHEPGKVKNKRQDIKNGKEKPFVAVDRPGHNDLFLMDGHHHYEAAVQLDKSNYPAYVVKVPSTSGPWDELHDQQLRNKDA